MPPIRYDESLPVHAQRAEIAAAIAASPVVIVSGATGSGKSTQLPKICLELGRGVDGMIGHTQPRRIAAQALASRLATELGTPLGDLVGYQVRFVDRTSPRTLIKLMTDGVLLRELERDPLAARYDTLIVDEAHERNLNVDFLLGVCRRLLPARPELRVIVTSATIETRRFAEFFGGAPVIEVEGRSLPGRGPLPADRSRRRIAAAARRSRGARCGGARARWARDHRRRARVPAGREADTARRASCCGASRRWTGGAAALLAAVDGRSRSGSSRRTRRSGSCWPPTSRKPRSRSRACAS